MRKNKKFLLLTVLTMMTGATFAFMAGCNKKDMITYSFETNGGATIADVKVEAGNSLDLPVPEREGYSFEGWYTNAEFDGDPVTSVVAESGLTYYAKWAQLFAITLEDDGSLAGTTLYLKAGENVYDFMQNYVPVKEGFQFGAWFNGENEISKNTRMPEGTLTLSAKYKVGYTVELMLQNIDKSGYTKSEEVITGYEYVGAEFAPEAEVPGFRAVSRDDARALSEKASENVFQITFDRQEYTVSFNTNYPDGTENAGESVKVIYGVEVEFPNDYLCEGYCLVGWATSAGGEVIYDSDYVESVLYNKDENTSTESESFTPTRNTTLYAVWEKAYLDMFGGSDYIYLIEENGAEVIYLSRGGVFFKGLYNAESREFQFRANSETISGRFNTDGTFVLRDANRVGQSSTLLENGALVSTNYIQFDAYNGLTYYITNEEGITENESKGTYLVDENGYYTVSFTEGALAGETMTIVVGSVSVEGVATPVFQIRNDAEAEFGIIYSLYVDGLQLNAYNAYQFILTGFGIAYYNQGSSLSTTYYKMSEDMETLYLLNSSGAVSQVARIIDINGNKGYMFYSQALDQTFKLATGGTLKLDGLYNATYTNGSKTVTGYYTTTGSVFGGTIVTVQTASQTYKFLITATTTDVPVVGGEEGETESVTTYIVEEKNAGYAEYYYAEAPSTNSIYYAPMLVVNDPAEGEATLYAYTKTGEFVKASQGTFVRNETTGLYVYTTTKFFTIEEEVFTDNWDVSTVQAFVCDLDSALTSYNISYWYSATTGEGTTDRAVVYSEVDGDASLTIVGGFAIHSEDGFVQTGSYEVQNGLTYIVIGGSYFCVELIEEDKTFIKLDDSPYGVPYSVDSLLSENESLSFDGKGGVTYTVLTLEGEEVVETVYTGTYTFTDKSSYYTSYPIYTFQADGMTFEFILISNSSASYFARYDEANSGEYSSNGEGRLTLDGFGYVAVYVDADGVEHVGMYAIGEENVIYLSADDTYFIFDMKEENEETKFTLRGLEAGSYVIMDNQSFTEYLIELDGYNNLTVYTYEEDQTAENGYKRVDIDTEGSYELDGDKYVLRYQEGNTPVVLSGMLGTYGNYYVFVVDHEEIVRSYVNEEDWSVLVLDGYGNATKYDKAGNSEAGMYELVTDSLLYYVMNEAASEADACIYEYNKATGTATPITFTAKAYYTSDLECLLFSKAGFAIFNGTERYYYNVEIGEDGKEHLIVYTQNDQMGTPNAYGYVREDWGLYQPTLNAGEVESREYNGKTYYANSGYAVAFNRGSEGANKFPVLVEEDLKKPLEQLVFTPSGEAEFTVEGSVYVNGENYSCYVTREVDDEGNVSMYVTVGYYRFDIEVSYTGVGLGGTNNNTYEVTDMRWTMELFSYSYLDTYYMYYLMYVLFGDDHFVSYTNEIGTITLVREYDEDGEETEYYMNAVFGSLSGIKDTTGKLLAVDKGKIVENGNLITTEIQGEDGYTYNLYFTTALQSILNTYGYQLVAFTRVETLTTEDGAYTVEVERVIASDFSDNYPAGTILTISLQKGEEKLMLDTGLTIGNSIYYIVRAKDDDGNVTATEYYKIDLAEKSSDGTIEGEEKGVALYESVTVVQLSGAPVYTEDGASFADITDEDGVILLSIEGTAYYVSSCEKNSETGVYTVVTYSGSKYTVAVADGKAVIEEVTETEDTATDDTTTETQA